MAIFPAERTARAKAVQWEKFSLWKQPGELQGEKPKEGDKNEAERTEGVCKTMYGHNWGFRVFFSVR